MTKIYEDSTPLKHVLLLIILLSSHINFAQNVLPKGFKQYRVTIPSNASNWVKTGIMVPKGDFVIFEVSGEVKLGSFLNKLDKVKAYGAENELAAVSFNRFIAMRHGALLCQNQDEQIHTIGSEVLVNPKKIYAWSKMEEDFVGNVFVSKTNQELSFVVNDTGFLNNVGEFTVVVTIIPFELHQKRNIYNKCPNQLPVEGSGTDGYYDKYNNAWTNALKELVYHGGGVSNFWLNNTYRGKSNNVLGCQCTYDGNKLVNNQYQGTFDYAFALKSLRNQMKYHILWDVFTHEYYNEYFESIGKVFEYEPTKNRY